ncbi:MAG: hypothetical protein AAF502_25175 [Bacteroidota bacterium]
MRVFQFCVIATAVILLTSSCKKQNSLCSMEVAGETLLLSDTSINLISNYLGATKVVFNDISDNSEVDFIITDLTDILVSYSTTIACEVDPSQVSPLVGEAQWIQLTLENADLQDNIIVRITQFPDGDEEIGVFYGVVEEGQFDFSNIEGLLVHLPQRAEPVFSVVNDSLMIGGITFYDVIEPNIDNPGFSQPFDPPIKVKYSAGDGIIYLDDSFNSRELVFNRVE